MAAVVLGTANLFGAVDDTASHAVLAAAWAHGVRRFDTAPSYGHGRSEGAVGALIEGRGDTVTVTTKVGIEPTAPVGRATGLAKSLARRLPQPVQQRLRGDGPPGGGHFAVDDVRRSIDRSLTRLPHIDRLLLHEVRPDDITPELVDCLRGYLDAGLVGRVGVATANAWTAACLARDPELLTVAHLAVGLRAVVPVLDAAVLVVGHGALGPGGADLRAVTARAGARRPTQELVAALIALAVRPATSAGGPAELIVATSRPERIAPLAQLVDAPVEIGPDLAAVLDEVAAAD